MRILYNIIFFFYLTNFFAQSSSIGLVNYGHKLSMGLGAPVGIDYNANLTFNKTKSSYVYSKDSLEGSHINEIISKRFGNKAIIRSKVTNDKGFIYFHDLNTKIAKYRDLGFRYVKEDIPKIEWKISNETKQIGGYNCRKATGHFRGREYTAWFTLAIPLPFGPWKLQGLPGLILEAHDTNKEVYFYFKSVKYPYSKKAYIVEPNPIYEQKKWISFETYKKEILQSFNKAIENGRLVQEQSSVSILESNKVLMKDTFIEIFDQ